MELLAVGPVLELLALGFGMYRMLFEALGVIFTVVDEGVCVYVIYICAGAKQATHRPLLVPTHHHHFLYFTTSPQHTIYNW
jgi:hypothetical protein